MKNTFTFSELLACPGGVRPDGRTCPGEAFGEAGSQVRATFTLIELLVVVAIIAILASLLLPALSRAQATAQRAACLNNLRQIAIGTLTYADDFDEFIPGTGLSHARDYVLNAHLIAGSAMPVGTGLLVTQGYVDKAAAARLFYCPGRQSGDRMTAKVNCPGVGTWDTFPAGNIETSYLLATANWGTGGDTPNGEDFGRWHRLSTVLGDKLLAMDYCMKSNLPSTGWAMVPYGTVKHRHGGGYNTARFDGSGNWLEDAQAMLETTFGHPGTSINPWQYSNSNLIYYLHTQRLGWSDATYRSACPWPPLP